MKEQQNKTRARLTSKQLDAKYKELMNGKELNPTVRKTLKRC